MTGKPFEIEGARATLFIDAPDWEERDTAAIGKFTCDNPEAGAAILGQIGEVVQKSGVSRLIGPMEGDTWHSYRLVTQTDGREPFLMEPSSGPHDLTAFKTAGFAPIDRYYSASYSLSEIDDSVTAPDSDLSVVAWDGTDAEALFAKVHDLSCKAFAQNPFYKPISPQTFLGMYMPIVPLLKRELIFFARDGDGTLQGFLFGIPNYAEGQSPETAILKTYASLKKGAGYMLMTNFDAAAKATGFRTAIHALMHEDNLSAKRSSMYKSTIFRHYALMGRRLDE